MTHSKERRARRIAKTLSIAARRRDEHTRTHYDETTGLAEVDCICQLAATYFAKRRLGCGCRKQRKGRPKIAGGMCKIGDRDRIHQWRFEARGLRIEAWSGRVRPR